jgi:hypothetical protein
MPSAVIVALIIAEMKRQIGKLIAAIGYLWFSVSSA